MSHGRLRWAGTLLALVLGGLTVWQTHAWAERASIEAIRAEAGHQLDLYVRTLESELSRFDYLPMVLSLSREVMDVFTGPRDGHRIDTLNRYLRDVSDQAGTSAIFVLDPRGQVLAASNWDDPMSFVGRNFSFRPYFSDAMGGLGGRFYGIGTAGGEPGYYFSRGIFVDGMLLGVGAVKVSLDAIEQEWAGAPGFVLVTDHHGVVLLSSAPGLKFRALQPVPPEVRRALDETRQYQGAPLEPIGLEPLETAGGALRRVRLGGRELLAHARELPATRWTVTILSDLSPARAFARNTAAAALFGLGSAALLALNLMQRRRVIRARLEARDALQRAHDELERKVAERTADLRRTNRQLEAEIEERYRAETVLRDAQEQLVQAGKLAVLGQFSAGITHELNQPLAAMRTLSDNALVRLERGEAEAARRNLETVSGLIERMGRITAQLKNFVRKSPSSRSAVSIQGCVRHALAIVDQKIRADAVEVEVDLPAAPLVAWGDGPRIEQVLVNLFANALDAMRASPLRTLRIEGVRAGDRIEIRVQDSGRGIPADVLPRLFEPFFTTKPAGEGLGLGLAISAGIVRDCGGTLRPCNLAHGAEFIIELPHAGARAEGGDGV